ncbi:transposase, partial [Waddlia chondrophila 2032/99]
ELCRNKKNQQWLWLAFHSASRQVLAMHVGKRDKRAAEALLAKLPEDLKKKPSFTLIGSLCTTKSFLGSNTRQSEKIQEKRVTLKDLTTP